MQNILVDIGSSSVKAYLLEKKQLIHLYTKSFNLKDGFDPHIGLTPENNQALFDFVKKLQTDYPKSKILAYGTALFRKFTPEAFKKFNEQFTKNTNATFTLITQDEENEYLEYALLEKFTYHKPVLLINIGGGSTELVIVQDMKTMSRTNIDIGVGTLLSEFTEINKSNSLGLYQKVTRFCLDRIPKTTIQTEIAYSTGGELTFTRLAEYNLQKNSFFQDTDHPVMITGKDYVKRNKEIFEKMTIQDLEKLMPENPSWMQGARAFLALSDAICEVYRVKYVIPSDSNLINGIVRKDF